MASPSSSVVARVAKGEDEEANTLAPAWTPLYRTAALGAIATLVLIPVQLAVFAIWPLSGQETAADWFTLLQENRVAGLVSLDFLLVVDWILLVPIFLALYVMLRPLRPSWTTIGIAIWLVSMAAFLASNPSVEMVGLSDRYAASTDEAERASLVAAGEAMLAQWEGTAFQVSYVLGQLAGIMFGVVMLQSPAFLRTEAWLLIVGNAVGFGYYLPEVGLLISAFSGLVLWAWYVLAARSLVRLGWPKPAKP